MIRILALTAFTIFLILHHPFSKNNKGTQNFPEKVSFRTKQETYNGTYDFILRQCTIWYRKKDQTNTEWKKLKLHKKLTCPKEISADGQNFVALDSLNNIYTMFRAHSENIKKFKWTKRWGAPFRRGFGMRVPLDNNGWELSHLSPVEDQYYLAFNGNKYDVGKGVVNIFVLSNKGQRITYIDPWLPNDLSYEVGSPKKGRFQSVSMSSTGSTLFLINKFGDMYTRTYDFDMVGADDFFFNYSYDKEEYTVQDTAPVLPRKIPRPLPLPGWMKQPKINGTLTNRITVHKSGRGTTCRTLMVEGRDSLGNTGYYTKDINAKTWQFVRTGFPLAGRVLENCAEDKSDSTLGPDESMKFQCTNKDITIELFDFHPYCSPATLQITLAGCRPFMLSLHTHETIHLRKRERGLTDKYLPLRGAIEVPDELKKKRETLEPAVREFIDARFDTRQFTEIKVKVKQSKMKIRDPFNFRWTLVRTDR
jgi:hypothetical protein